MPLSRKVRRSLGIRDLHNELQDMAVTSILERNLCLQ